MTNSSSNERTNFEAWLLKVHGLESEWQEMRNCYKEFAAHLAFCAWQARGSALPAETP